jgi:hypothetical protein
VAEPHPPISGSTPMSTTKQKKRRKKGIPYVFFFFQISQFPAPEEKEEKK